MKNSWSLLIISPQLNNCSLSLLNDFQNLEIKEEISTLNIKDLKEVEALNLDLEAGQKLYENFSKFHLEREGVRFFLAFYCLGLFFIFQSLLFVVFYYFSKFREIVLNLLLPYFFKSLFCFFIFNSSVNSLLIGLKKNGTVDFLKKKYKINYTKGSHRLLSSFFFHIIIFLFSIVFDFVSLYFVIFDFLPLLSFSYKKSLVQGRAESIDNFLFFLIFEAIPILSFFYLVFFVCNISFFNLSINNGYESGVFTERNSYNYNLEKIQSYLNQYNRKVREREIREENI